MKITFSKQEKIDIIENTISWIVVFMMCAYGVGKIVQFNGAIDVEKTLPELTGMELMWAFYGYSLPFAIIIGTLEVTGGLLIFFKRTRIIGCLFTSFILINIILQNIIFDVKTGALISAIIYQLLILIILWMNKTILFDVIKLLTNKEEKKYSLKKRIIPLFITFILFVILLFLIHYSTSFLSHL